jgi:hypothetical protein
VAFCSRRRRQQTCTWSAYCQNLLQPECQMYRPRQLLPHLLRHRARLLPNLVRTLRTSEVLEGEVMGTVVLNSWRIGCGESVLLEVIKGDQATGCWGRVVELSAIIRYVWIVHVYRSTCLHWTKKNSKSRYLAMLSWKLRISRFFFCDKTKITDGLSVPCWNNYTKNYLLTSFISRGNSELRTKSEFFFSDPCSDPAPTLRLTGLDPVPDFLLNCHFIFKA